MPMASPSRLPCRLLGRLDAGAARIALVANDTKKPSLALFILSLLLRSAYQRENPVYQPPGGDMTHRFSA
jgi:hypothetical protein